VTDCQLEIQDVTDLKKIGLDIAVGSVRLRTEVKVIGNPFFLNLFTSATMGNSYDTLEHVYTNEVVFNNVTFKKVDGNWKIAEINGYSTHEYKTAVRYE